MGAQGSNGLGQGQLPQFLHVSPVYQTLCGVQNVVLHYKETKRKTIDQQGEREIISTSEKPCIQSQTSHCGSVLSHPCATQDVYKSLYSRHQPFPHSHPDTQNNTHLPLHIAKIINFKAQKVFRQQWDGESGRAGGRVVFG